MSIFNKRVGVVKGGADVFSAADSLTREPDLYQALRLKRGRQRDNKTISRKWLLRRNERATD